MEAYFRHSFLGLLILAVVSTTVYSSESLVLGVHPYRPHNELLQMFKPLAGFLSRQLGQLVVVRVGDSYQAHQDAIIRGDVDFAYIGPSLFVTMSQNDVGFPILARLEVNGKPTFTGKIIVRKESDLHTLEELKQCHFAFGSPSSSMSHLVPRQMLYEAGIDIDDFSGHRFYSNHNNVALAVLAGDADAGAVKEAIYDKYRGQGIIAIGSTAEISEHLFIATQNTDPILVTKLRQTLLSLSRQNEMTDVVLKPIKKSATALVPANYQNYQALREILDALRKRGVQW